MAICKTCGKKYCKWTTPVSARGVCRECFESELEKEAEAKPKEYASAENAARKKSDESSKEARSIAVVRCSIPAPRKIKIFIAGALALTGFENVIALTRYFAVPGAFIGMCVLALQLPLGVGLLVESAIALRLTKIYLWLFVVLGCLLVLLTICIPRAQYSQIHFANALLLRSTTNLLVYSILLGLLLWSGWRERRNERHI